MRARRHDRVRRVRGLKWRVVGAAVLGLLAAVLIIYKPSFNQMRLTPRVRSFGVAQTQVLVDSAASPLADAISLTYALGQLATNLAGIVSSPAIIEPVARSVGVPVRDIAVTDQNLQEVSRTLSYQQEAQVGNSIITDARNYSILLRVDQGSFVIQIYTQAPTTNEAVRLANSTASGLVAEVHNLVVSEKIPVHREIILRQIGPAYGGTVDPSITVDALVLLAAILFILFLIALTWLSRTRTATAAARTPAPTSSMIDGRLETNAPRPDLYADGNWPRTTRILPWLIAFLLAMIYLVPFDSISLPIHLPINSNLDRFVLGGVFLVWLTVGLAGEGRVRLRRSPMNVAIFVFVLVCVLSIAVNLRALTWDGELTLSLKELSLAVSYIALFYICATSIRGAEVLAYIRLLVALGVLTAIGTIYQYRTGTNPFFSIAGTLFGASHVASAASQAASVSPAAAGTAARPLVTGPTIHGLADVTLMAVALPFALVLATYATRKREIAVWLLAAALLLGGCVATGEKSGLLVPFVSFMVLLAYGPRRYLRLWPLLILGFVAVELLPHALSRLVYQISNAGSGASTQGRTADYPGVVPFVLSHLIIGRGYGSFDPFKYRILDDQMLGWLVEIGVVGAVSYMAIMAAAIASAFRVALHGAGIARPLMQGVIAATAGFFLSNFLYDTFGFRQAPYIFFFVAALGVACSGDYAVSHPAPVSDLDHGAGDPDRPSSPPRDVEPALSPAA